MMLNRRVFLSSVACVPFIGHFGHPKHTFTFVNYEKYPSWYRIHCACIQCLNGFVEEFDRRCGVNPYTLAQLKKELLYENTLLFFRTDVKLFETIFHYMDKGHKWQYLEGEYPFYDKSEISMSVYSHITHIESH